MEFKKPADFTLKLSDVLSKSKMDHIKSANKLVFQMAGDTGGINGQETQEAIAYQMEKQISQAHKKDEPAFFYNLGDVVYYNGMTNHYEEQFYDPYKYYPTYIFAIPGNHDCDTSVRKGNEPDTEESMLGFMTNFCDKTPGYGPYSSYRKTMNEPWPYWVLDAPFVTIVGLFSNVDGSLDNDSNTEQLDWLIEQLKNAPKDKCLVVTIHHPPFSLDSVHGGYPVILDNLDKAFKKANRQPDAIFSGHVHNFQRFTRTVNGNKIPYIISGAAGYVNKPTSMHRLQRDTNGDFIIVPFQTLRNDLVLNCYNQVNPGFLKITVDGQFITGEYYVLNFDGSKPPSTPDDTFKFNWKNNRGIPIE